MACFPHTIQMAFLTMLRDNSDSRNDSLSEDGADRGDAIGAYAPSRRNGRGWWRLLRRHAGVVGRGADIAAGRTDVARFLRIGAKRPAARCRRRGETCPRCDDLVWCIALFDPCDQGCQHVELIG